MISINNPHVQIMIPNTNRVFLKGIINGSNLSITEYVLQNEFDINFNNPKTQDELFKKGICKIECRIRGPDTEQIENLLKRIGFEVVKIRQEGLEGGGGQPENFIISDIADKLIYIVLSNVINLIPLNYK